MRDSEHTHVALEEVGLLQVALAEDGIASSMIPLVEPGRVRRFVLGNELPDPDAPPQECTLKVGAFERAFVEPSPSKVCTTEVAVEVAPVECCAIQVGLPEVGADLKVLEGRISFRDEAAQVHHPDAVGAVPVPDGL